MICPDPKPITMKKKCFQTGSSTLTCWTHHLETSPSDQLVFECSIAGGEVAVCTAEVTIVYRLTITDLKSL